MMSRMTTKVVCVVGLVTLFLLPLPSLAEEPKSSTLPKAIAIGAPSIGSGAYVLAVGIAHLVSRNTPISATCESVGGTDANIRALKAGKIELAMANSYGAANAYRGIQQFAKEGKIPLRLVAQGHPSIRGLVATLGSGIKTPEDLKGKKLVAKRRALREIELMADAVLKAYGIDKADVTYITTAKTPEAVEALRTGTVDAAIFPATMVNPNIVELSQTVGIALISFSADKMEIILRELGPAFYSETIPAGTYKGQNKDVHWPSLQMTLSTTERLGEEVVYLVAKTVMDRHEDFKLVQFNARYWTVERTLKHFSIPFHSGAVRYYKEIGAWTSECEKTQRSLLKTD